MTTTTVIGLIATLAYPTVFTSLCLPTGRSPVRHAVSDNIVGRYAPPSPAGWIITTAGNRAIAEPFMLGFIAFRLAVTCSARVASSNTS